MCLKSSDFTDLKSQSDINVTSRARRNVLVMMRATRGGTVTRGAHTSGWRLLTSSTQTPAGSEGNPILAAPARESEVRAPGRAGTVTPAGGRNTERGGRSQRADTWKTASPPTPSHLPRGCRFTAPAKTSQWAPWRRQPRATWTQDGDESEDEDFV